jgi:hypothetical protein
MKLNKRKIAAVLRESVFSPTDNPLMKVICDVGNTDYYITRAEEELFKAKQVGVVAANKHLTLAVSLLVLAKIHLDG